MEKYVKGFTLVELIIVISVITTISVIGIASFVDYSRRQTLNTAASDLIVTFQKAKANAASQVKISSCSDKTLDAYQIDISFAEQTYGMSAICSGVVYPITSETKTLPSGITFDQIGTTQTEVIFRVITGGVDTAGKVVIQGYGEKRTLEISQQGTITTYNGDVPTPTPTP